jgi:hypothetical protein
VAVQPAGGAASTMLPMPAAIVTVKPLLTTELPPVRSGDRKLPAFFSSGSSGA